MKLWKSRFCLTNVGTLYYLLAATSSAMAQIVPDATLPNNSLITDQDNISTITGGTQADSNLFHSFEQFSVPTGGAAYFNNAPDIQNIISRITGGSISKIDGLIRANGTANLFLLNPDGIIFGSNARLNIGGSFIASTANSINFADGTQFNANYPQATPLLTISVPIGLQFGNSPSAIRVQGTGHNLTIPAPFFSPILNANGSSNGLQVPSEKTIALVGGNVSLEGGTLTAPGGRIELGAVGSGIVALNHTSSGWTLGYSGVEDFQNIKLSQQALIDANSFGGSSIQLVGKQISLTEGSVVLVQNQAPRLSGSISVNASESLELSGTTSDGKIPSGFQSETLGGPIGDIVVSTKHLGIQDGAAINAKTFTEANAGNIILKASESIQIIGFSSTNSTAASSASGIGDYTLSSGKSGEIVINTGQLTVLNGGTVISGSFGTGKGGDLIINASQGIQLKGFNPILAAPSQLAVGTFSTGNTGNMTIKTPNIFLQNGGNINSYTFFAGKAGNITIDTSHSIEIAPANPGELAYALPFGISSFAAPLPDATRQILRVPPVLSGDSGNVTINTKRVTATSNALIEASNLGTGKAGRLRINADVISLKNNANIAASTASGEGGDIFLQARSLQLRQNSSVNATASDPRLIPSLPVNSIATGTGNGGNITINADILAASENSDISANAFQGNGGNVTINAGKLVALTNSNLSANTVGGNGGNLAIDTSTLAAGKNSNITANAVQGQGGNIRINTQALFRSPDSKITASSQLGINGTVQINTMTTNPSRGLVNLPAELVDVSELIAQECPGTRGTVAKGASFVVVGRSGLPPQPTDPLRVSTVRVAGDIPEAEVETRLRAANTDAALGDLSPQLVEAQDWVINSKGDVVLTAQPIVNPSPSSNPLTCYAP